jgi:hypothetical protein
VEKKNREDFLGNIITKLTNILFYPKKPKTTQYTYEHEATQDHEVDYES